MNNVVSIPENKGKTWRVWVFHIAGWLLFMSLPLLFSWHNTDFAWGIMRKFFWQIPLFMFFFYLNYFFLIPRFFTQGDYLWYILLMLLSLLLMSILFEVFDHWSKVIRPEQHPPLHHKARQRLMGFPGLFSGLLVFGVSTSLRISHEWIKNEKQRKELENQTLKSELSFLKSQVNPHFLFNTLNNIYSLSLGRSEQTPEAIMKLSQLLRYMLYETDDKSVALDREIAYIEDYISLQRMRLTDQVKVSLKKEGEMMGKQIEPLLLIPFVENAFKHGVYGHQPSYIDIAMKVKDDELELTVANSLLRHPAAHQPDRNSGIGLNNVEKRLNLLYPGRHVLVRTITDTEYRVSLKINLV